MTPEEVLYEISGLVHTEHPKVIDAMKVYANIRVKAKLKEASDRAVTIFGSHWAVDKESIINTKLD